RATLSARHCSTRSACRWISTTASRSARARSARSRYTPAESASSPSASAPASSERVREGGGGSGCAGLIGAVRGREEVEGAGFTGEEQPAIDRHGEVGAVVGMAGQRVGIGAAEIGLGDVLAALEVEKQFVGKAER